MSSPYLRNMSDQILKDIKVIGVEKPQKGKFREHFVSYIDDSKYGNISNVSSNIFYGIMHDQVSYIASSNYLVHFSMLQEYVIKVTYENGNEHLIFRRYSMLFHFHVSVLGNN